MISFHIFQHIKARTSLDTLTCGKPPAQSDELLPETISSRAPEDHQTELFMQTRAGFHVKSTSYPYFNGGRWDRGIFLQKTLLNENRCGGVQPVPFSLDTSAASILNSLGGFVQNSELVFIFFGFVVRLSS
jgi:hypothetical protein